MSSSSESSELRKYGLEFIKDLANDRKYAMQSLSVAVSSFKTQMKQSNIVTRRDDREYLESLLKSFDKEAKHTIESQLTQITLKSLKWIKSILIRDERIIIKEEGKDEGLVKELEVKINRYSSEIQELKQNSQSLQGQLRSKEADAEEINRNHNKITQELQQELTIERSRVESQTNQVNTHQEAIKGFQEQIEDKVLQFTKLQEQFEASNLLLIDKNADISRLKSELKSINESLDASSQDAMAVWAQSYQELEQSHQKTITQLKTEYEEMTKNRIEENNENHQKEINQVTQKFNEERAQTETELRELNIKNQDLGDKFIQLDSEVSVLTQQKNEYLNELTDNKTQIEKLENELKEIGIQKEESYKLSIADIKKSVTDLKNINDYIDQILALSNYAPIAILLRMNGQMKLEHLAKSVGMDPIVLDNQLQTLNQRDLIDIRSDGLIVANIPSSHT